MVVIETDAADAVDAADADAGDNKKIENDLIEDVTQEWNLMME